MPLPTLSGGAGIATQGRKDPIPQILVTIEMLRQERLAKKSFFRRAFQ